MPESGSLPQVMSEPVPLPADRSEDTPSGEKRQRRSRGLSLSTMLALGFGTLVALSLGAVLFVAFGRAALSTQTLYLERAESVIDNMESRLRDSLDPILENEQALRAALADGRLALDPPGPFLSYLRGMVDSHAQLTGAAVIGSDGRFWKYLARSDGFVFDRIESHDQDGERPQILNILKTEAASWGPIVRSTSVGATIINRDMPLGTVDGVDLFLAQVVSVDQFSSFVAAGLPKLDGTVFVLYGGNHVLAHPSLSKVQGIYNREIPLPHVLEIGDAALEEFPNAEPGFLEFSEETGTRIHWRDMPEGEDRVYITRPVDGYARQTLVLGIHFPDEVDGELAALYQALWIAVGILVFSLIAAIVMGRRVARPMEEVVAAMEAVKADRLDDVPRIHSRGIRELAAIQSGLRRMVSGLREREHIRNQFGKYVPDQVARALLTEQGSPAVQEGKVTVLFADLAKFTDMTQRLGAARTVAVLNAYFSKVVNILETRGGLITQFQGDAVLAVFNLPEAREDQVALTARAALQAGCEILEATAPDAAPFAGETLTARVG
ncbi:MAG: adenylate/guanylate cyclase domain-containing protein, partial [Rhodospirillaceae bacterium]